MKRWLPGITILGAILVLSACSPSAPLPPGDLPEPEGDRSYVGLPKGTAVARASSSGERWRVVEEDGRRFPITKDRRPDRLNFVVRDGVVVAITKG